MMVVQYFVEKVKSVFSSGRVKMQLLFKKGVIIIVFFLISMLIGGCQDGEPNYKQPGSEGTLPENWKTDFEISEENRGYPPLTFLCNKEIATIFAIVTKEVESCELVNYKDIYNQAKADITAKAKEIKCPEECRRLETWELSRVAKCIPFDESMSIAMVRLYYGVGCFDKKHQKPKGLPAPTEEDFDYVDKFGMPKPPLKDTEDNANVSLNSPILPALVKCGQTKRFKITHYAVVPNCQDLNFRPHVDRAKFIAFKKWSGMKCEEGCSKTAFKIFRTEWRCDSHYDQDGDPMTEDDLHIAIAGAYFEVVCRKNK